MPLMKIARARGKLPNGIVKNRRLHNDWNTMRRRCYDPSFISYQWYGAKGVGVCEAWRRDYVSFQEWALSHGFREDLTLDRIDSTKDYSPENCRWATKKEQSSNRPTWNIKVTVNGVTKLVSEWADEAGANRSAIYGRIRTRGWDPVKAVTTPLKVPTRGPVTVNGESHTVFTWAKILGVQRARIYRLVNVHGMKPADAVRRMMKEKGMKHGV